MPVRFNPLIPRAFVCAALGLLSVWAGSRAACAQSAIEGREETPETRPASLGSAVASSQAEQELFDRADAGTLVASELFAAALVASGVHEPDERQSYDARLRQLVGRLRDHLRDAGDPAADPVRRASLVHAFLHAVILTGAYDLSCSRISQAMDTGRYNCVSATILFNVLASETGLETSGGESPAHVVSIVRATGGPLHVETTCPRWFELRAGAAPPATTNVFGSSLRFAAREYRRLGVPELVALVYYNIGVDFAEQRRYADALAANAKALRLDRGNSSARANLLAAINNWALELAQAEQFEQAVALLVEGRQIAPEHPTFAVNDAAVRERWVRALCQRGQWSQAAAVLDDAEATHPGLSTFAGMKRQLADQRAWHDQPGSQ